MRSHRDHDDYQESLSNSCSCGCGGYYEVIEETDTFNPHSGTWIRQRRRERFPALLARRGLRAVPSAESVQPTRPARDKAGLLAIATTEFVKEASKQLVGLAKSLLKLVIFGLLML